MGAEYTESQKTAFQTYMRDKHVLRVVTTKEKAENIKKHASPSVNAYIMGLIEEDFKKRGLKL